LEEILTTLNNSLKVYDNAAVRPQAIPDFHEPDVRSRNALLCENIADETHAFRDVWKVLAMSRTVEISNLRVPGEINEFR